MGEVRGAADWVLWGGTVSRLHATFWALAIVAILALLLVGITAVALKWIDRQ